LRSHVKKDTGKNVYLFRSQIPRSLQSVFGKKQFTVSLKTSLQRDAQVLSQYLYQYCQNIYRSIEFGHSRLTLAEVKQLVRKELQDYRMQIGLDSFVKFEAVEAEMQLSELLDRFHQFKQSSGSSPNSLYRIEFVSDLLLNVCSDLEISKINHATAREFYQHMDQLELKVSSKKVYASTVVTAFNWATNQGYVKSNYFSGKMKFGSDSQQMSDKQPFSKDEMQLVLGPKLLGWSFMEHNTVSRRFGKRRQPTPDYYWIVNIAAYTGARLGEIAQLTTEDVELTNGVWCFSFNARAGKSIKNLSSCRQVPIHSRLLELGLLDYIESCNDKLFQKNRSAIGDWFSRKLLNELSLSDVNRSFHSLRHTVITDLTNKQVFPYFVKELVGHKHNSVTYDVYAGQPPMKVLLSECVNKISYWD